MQISRDLSGSTFDISDPNRWSFSQIKFPCYDASTSVIIFRPKIDDQINCSCLAVIYLTWIDQSMLLLSNVWELLVKIGNIDATWKEQRFPRIRIIEIDWYLLWPYKQLHGHHATAHLGKTLVKVVLCAIFLDFWNNYN